MCGWLKGTPWPWHHWIMFPMCLSRIIKTNLWINLKWKTKAGHTEKKISVDTPMHAKLHGWTDLLLPAILFWQLAPVVVRIPKQWLQLIQLLFNQLFFHPAPLILSSWVVLAGSPMAQIWPVYRNWPKLESGVASFAPARGCWHTMWVNTCWRWGN